MTDPARGQLRERLQTQIARAEKALSAWDPGGPFDHVKLDYDRWPDDEVIVTEWLPDFIAVMREAISRLGEPEAPAPVRNDELLDALQPFASIGAWLFARPEVPDDETMVEIQHINGVRGRFTRGDFKAAYLAFESASKAIAKAQEPAESPARSSDSREDVS